MSAFPPPIRIETQGVTLSVHDSGGDGPMLLLCHGWPELAYSWSPMWDALTEAGYRLIAPDQRGFGGSDCPPQVEAYRIDALVGDLTGLLDHFDIETAYWVGHDWGGLVVWHAARLAAERIQGVIALNTPHFPRPPVRPTEALKARYGSDHYIVRFQEEGLCEALFEAHIDAFFGFLMQQLPGDLLDRLNLKDPPPELFDLPARFRERVEPWGLVRQAAMALSGRMSPQLKAALPRGPFGLPRPPRGGVPIMSAADRAVYVNAFRKTGFRPGLNWYRNFDANWELMADFGDRIPQPALMIAAEHDVFLPPHLTDAMVDLIPDLTRHFLPGVGHWTSWEAPDAAAKLMIDWLSGRG